MRSKREYMDIPAEVETMEISELMTWDEAMKYMEEKK